MKRITTLGLPLAALLLATSCTDSNYDLSDIDTHSRLDIKGLSIPVNIDPIPLDIMLDIADDSDIKTDAEGNYYFRKSGDFNSDPINVKKITLERPTVDIKGDIAVNFHLDDNIKSVLAQHAPNTPIKDIVNDPTLMESLGIHLTTETELMHLTFDQSTTESEISLEAHNIDKSVKAIQRLGAETSQVAIDFKVTGLDHTFNPFDLTGLELVMPRGFVATSNPNVTYDAKQGILKPKDTRFRLDNNYTADLGLTFNGINYDQLCEPGMKVFDPDRHTFLYKKTCSATGTAILTVADLKDHATYNDIVAMEQPNAVKYHCNIGFTSDITINSFLGDIQYDMDDIKVDPVVITGVPDMLKENGTNIDLSNPQIYLYMNNHLSSYGISVNGDLEIKGYNTITAPLTITPEAQTCIVMSPVNADLFHASGYNHQSVKALSTIVGSGEGETFPEELNIRVVEPQVPTTHLAEEFALGTDHEGVQGSWEFYTRLALTDKSKVKYTKEWDDWSDEDLNGLTVSHAVINVTLQKDVKLDAESIEFILYGDHGELHGQTALTGEEAQDIVLELTGEPVSEIKGGKVNVHLKGMNGDLNKHQTVKISHLTLTVDGYYERDL